MSLVTLETVINLVGLGFEWSPLPGQFNGEIEEGADYAIDYQTKFGFYGRLSVTTAGMYQLISYLQKFCHSNGMELNIISNGKIQVPYMLARLPHILDETATGLYLVPMSRGFK